MNAEELTAVLEEAGLSPYQSEAYVTLLDLGSASATDIAEASGVPDPRIYDVLRDLESKGYVETYKQGSLQARAHDPEEVMESLHSRAQRLSAAATEIEDRWETPGLEENVVSIVKRFETVIQRAEQFVGEAENQVQLSVTTDQFRRLRPALAEAYDRGVTIKLSIHTAHEADRSELPTEDELVGACTEARHRPLPSPFFTLVDRSKTCFAPHTDSLNEYGILVDDRTHTYVFHWFFLTCMWDVWTPFYREDAEDAVTTYTDIRYCLRDLRPLLEAGERVHARIDGIDTDTGEPRTVEGIVTDTVISGEITDGSEGVSVARFAGQAALVVDTGEGLVEIGGWGAALEDVEANRIDLEVVG